MSDDYDRAPLFQYTATYTKASLYLERPHELKDRSAGGAELKHLVYKIDGTWDIEYCVVENLERFLKAVAAYGWTGQRIYDMYELTLEGTALDDWKTVIMMPQFSGANQTAQNFLHAFQMLMQLIFNCVKQRDVQYRMFNREMVKKPKQLDPHLHEKRMRTMYRVSDLLKEGDQPLATVVQQRIWYFYTFCLEDRKEFVEKPKDPATTPINEITVFMKTCFDRKVRNKEIKPWARGEYQAILNQQVVSKRKEFHRRGRSRSRSPPIPRKRRNSRRPSLPAI